jgi:hypothetical protein
MVSSVPDSFMAEVGGGVVAQPARRARQALQAIVMEDHGVAVGGQLDVQLDRIAAGAGGLEGGQGVLRRAVRRPQAAMRHRRLEQALPRLAEHLGSGPGPRAHQATSTTASTSTAKPSGSL